MARFCGGIKLNSDTFEVRNGVITLVDTHSDDPLEELTTPCGQLWDAIIFETTKLDGRHYVLTAAGVDTEIPMMNPIKTNCGLYVDPRFFSIDAEKILDFTERHLLEVLVNPPEAEYTITVALTTEPDTPIEPFEEGGNVYPLDEIDGEYTVTVTADGYEEFTQSVTADSDTIVQATLTPNQP